MADKVMSPKNQSRPGATTRATKSGIIEGATATLKNLTPYNRKKG